MIIALDYDGTFTSDPDLWIRFILDCQRQGHKIVVVTMRYITEIDGTHDMIDPRLNSLSVPIPRQRGAYVNNVHDLQRAYVSQGHSASEEGAIRGSVVRIFMDQHAKAFILLDGVLVYTVRRSTEGIKVSYGSTA